MDKSTVPAGTELETKLRARRRGAAFWGKAGKLHALDLAATLDAGLWGAALWGELGSVFSVKPASRVGRGPEHAITRGGLGRSCAWRHLLWHVYSKLREKLASLPVVLELRFSVLLWHVAGCWRSFRSCPESFSLFPPFFLFLYDFSIFFSGCAFVMTACSSCSWGEAVSWLTFCGFGNPLRPPRGKMANKMPQIASACCFSCFSLLFFLSNPPLSFRQGNKRHKF